jgi:hypothetical protein
MCVYMCAVVYAGVFIADYRDMYLGAASFAEITSYVNYDFNKFEKTFKGS